MGLSIEDIGKGPMSSTDDYSIENGFVWICVRREERTDISDQHCHLCRKFCGKWYIQGIAFNEQTAIEMCRDETYFIGPLPVNTALPHSQRQWVGSYFPLR